MAWLDDRFWCHPKVANLSDGTFRILVTSIAYSAGFITEGHLSDGQLKVIGTKPRIYRELLESGLWEMNGDGIVIHDWKQHNGKRDAARERKRRERQRHAGEA